MTIEKYKKIFFRTILTLVIMIFIIFPLITLFGISYAAVKFTNNTSEGRCGMRFITSDWDIHNTDKNDDGNGYYGEKCSFDFPLMKSEIYKKNYKINFTQTLNLNQYTKFFKNKFSDKYILETKKFSIKTTEDKIKLNGLILQMEPITNFQKMANLKANIRPKIPKIVEDEKISSLNDKELIKYNPNNKKNTIIVHHGFQSNMWAMSYQIYPLLRSGYTVIIYNARNHGDSDSAQVTLSYKEAIDLKDIINYSLGKFNDLDNKKIENQYLAEKFGLYGYSMGGATVLRYVTQLSTENKPEFVIMESGFIDLELLLKEMIINTSGLPKWLIYPGAKMWWKILKGVAIDEIRPYDGINNIYRIPLYITYGTKDKIIPLEMASALYTQKIISEKSHLENKTISDIMQVKNAAHGLVPYVADLSNNTGIQSKPTYNWRKAILKFIAEKMKITP